MSGGEDRTDTADRHCARSFACSWSQQRISKLDEQLLQAAASAACYRMG